LYNERGRMRALLGLVDGNPGLILYDERDQARAKLLVLATGLAALSLHDERGKGQVLLDLDKKGASLALRDKGDKVRAVLGMAADGRPALGLFDEKGKVIWKAPPTEP